MVQDNSHELRAGEGFKEGEFGGGIQSAKDVFSICRNLEKIIKHWKGGVEALFHAFMEHLPGAAWIKDLEGRYICANPEAQRIFSIPLDKLHGKTDQELFPPEAARQFRENDRRVLAVPGGSLQTIEVLKYADGRNHFSIVSKFAIPGPNGQPRCIGGVAFDITEQKLAEEALQESERRFSVLFENAPVAVAMFSLDERCIRANQTACDFLGVSQEEMKQLCLQDIVYPEDLPLTANLIPALIAGDIPAYTIERRYRRKNGEIFWGRSTVALMSNAEGLPDYLIGTTADITDIIQARDAAAKNQAELERLVEERTANLREMMAEMEHFSYSITHDIRAPLRAMRGYAELISQEDCAGKGGVKDYLQRIISAADRMDLLITDALGYSKLARAELNLEPVDARALLRDILQSYPNLEAHRDEIRIEGDFPPVLASKAALTQCFSNLLGNAVKFTSSGVKPAIKVWAEDKGDRLRLWFEDNGIGIATEWQERIFQMFQQVKPGQGTGIGLALVRKAAERMGGEVGVESAPGKGSRFWLELAKSRDALNSYSAESL